jgi:hypothetical protein
MSYPFPYYAYGIYCKYKNIDMLIEYLSKYDIHPDIMYSYHPFNDDFFTVWDYKPESDEYILAKFHTIVYSTNKEAMKLDYKIIHISDNDIQAYKNLGKSLFNLDKLLRQEKLKRILNDETY